MNDYVDSVMTNVANLLLENGELRETICELKTEIYRLKEENWQYLEVAHKLKWATETNSILLAEIERLRQVTRHLLLR